ncbi:MAG: Co2+/Mg2+ efflux protein ApaG [Alphaproteobacteria bacterium]|nr:Co2+/Mg2+ efflux protein ApaG [Alphaproteobacteria bacterium]
MYQKTTRHISVHVEPRYLEHQSNPDDGKYVWSYTITLRNLGQETIKLLTRHWIITDGLGRMQEVRGDGVVGEQPVLPPGTAFQYTSGCPLATPSGVMQGSYGMITDQDEPFDVAIPAFSLDSPHDKHSVN